jgi:hypothetical protein
VVLWQVPTPNSLWSLDDNTASEWMWLQTPVHTHETSIPLWFHTTRYSQIQRQSILPMARLHTPAGCLSRVTGPLKAAASLSAQCKTRACRDSRRLWSSRDVVAFNTLLNTTAVDFLRQISGECRVLYGGYHTLFAMCSSRVPIVEHE